MRAKIQFSSVLNDQNLNNVLCYFSKSTNTQVIYALDLEGNSCYDHKVKNLYYNYPGQTFTSEKLFTNIYLITNPYLTSDPSITAFQTMYEANGQLSTPSLNAALSGFAINFLSSNYLGVFGAYGMIDPYNADSISISFDEPVF